MSVAVKDEAQAERALQKLLYATPEERRSGRGADLSNYRRYPRARKVPAVYVAPEYRIDTTDGHYGIRASHLRLLL